MTQNPFQILEDRLSRIEGLLAKLTTNNADKNNESAIHPTFNKIPVQDIFKRKMLSKPTFYKHVKAGKVIIYKLGGRSYVDVNEFNQVFHRVKLEV